jgi:hypothetical protein
MPPSRVRTGADEHRKRAAMETTAPKPRAREKDVFRTLAEDLRTEASPDTILEHLEVLITGLDDPLSGDDKVHTLEEAGKVAASRARIFLKAGGLPAVIRHLRGATTSDAPSGAISSRAATALWELLKRNDAVMAELHVAENVMLPLLDALRDAPAPVARSVAAQALLDIAGVHPGQGKVMAEAGVIGMVVAYHILIGALPEQGSDLPEAASNPAAALACVLMGSSMVAVRDLRRAILGPEADQAFAALFVLQVRPISHGCVPLHVAPVWGL